MRPSANLVFFTRRLLLGLLFSLLLACPSWPAAGDEVILPASDIAAEDAFWKELGLTLPAGGVLLEHPFSAPYTARSFIVPTAWWKDALDKLKKPGYTVNAAALRADLPLLRVILEKNYSGWETAAQHGWDWDAAFRKWDRQLAQAGSAELSPKDAFAEWKEIEDFQLDGHSGPLGVNVGLLEGTRSAMLSAKPTGACTSMTMEDGSLHQMIASDPAQQPHAVLAWNGEQLLPATYLSSPASRGGVRRVTCGTKTIEAATLWDLSLFVLVNRPSRASLSQDPALRAKFVSLIQPLNNDLDVPVYKTLAPGIGYFRLSSFRAGGFDEAVKAAPPAIGHERAIIFDLRANEGGGWPWAIDSIWGLPDPRQESNELFNQRSKTSCLSNSLAFEELQEKALGWKSPVSQKRIDEANAQLRPLAQPVPKGCPVGFSENHGKWNLSQHKFSMQPPSGRPRIILLVDSGCASDCEGFTYLLAKLPGSVIVGTSTYGVVGFAFPKYALLPHSRVIFAMATRLSDPYGDGRANSGYGLGVDIVLPGEQATSVDSLVKLAEALTQGEAASSKSDTGQGAHSPPK